MLYREISIVSMSKEGTSHLVQLKRGGERRAPVRGWDILFAGFSSLSRGWGGPSRSRGGKRLIRRLFSRGKKERFLRWSERRPWLARELGHYCILQSEEKKICSLTITCLEKERKVVGLSSASAERGVCFEGRERSNSLGWKSAARLTSIRLKKKKKKGLVLLTRV